MDIHIPLELFDRVAQEAEEAKDLLLKHTCIFNPVRMGDSCTMHVNVPLDLLVLNEVEQALPVGPFRDLFQDVMQLAVRAIWGSGGIKELMRVRDNLPNGPLRSMLKNLLFGISYNMGPVQITACLDTFKQRGEGPMPDLLKQMGYEEFNESKPRHYEENEEDETTD